MRKLVLLTLLGIVVALPLQARSKSESYIAYDEGGTIVRTGDDAREIDARVNLPVFPGDEVITNRRGRAEVRLADGNILAIDRATSVRLQSVLDSYDNDANDTVVVLRYGKVAVYRTGDATESFRLDTDTASYFAGEEAVFSVDTESGGRDRVQVFDGNIEVRTPDRTARLRSGESGSVDDRGVYDMASDGRSSADDFDRWFLARTEHYGNADSRYLDSSLAYSDGDLAQNGTWTLISGYGWGWRPYVNTGWRPYFYGRWIAGRHGVLTWVSYEPWGWVPYHYGRWAFDPTYGWFWMPGGTYAPAWVYWMYAPGYVGWAPAGWYDCYRPYYDWAYRPYRGGIDFGFGFYGRVRVHDVDLRPWTFVDANTVLSARIDRAAVMVDAVKSRILKDNIAGGLVAISGQPARFGRDEIHDPAAAVAAIYRRGVGGGGQTAGTPDLTPFFRRDPQLPETVRDRIVRTRPADGVATSRGSMTGVAPIGGGSVAPIGRGSVAPIGSGSLAPIGTTPLAPINPGEGQLPIPVAPQPGIGRDTGGHMNRDRGTVAPQPQPVPRDSWRSHAVRPAPAPENPPAATPPPTPRSTWRSGTVPRDGATPEPAPAPRSVERPRSYERGSDVPRRVIDGIGGARIAPAPAPRRESPPPTRRESGGSKERAASHSSGDHEKHR